MDEKGQADVAWWSLTTQITLKWPKLPRRVRRATPFPYRGSWWVMRKNLFRCASQHLLLKGQLLKTLFVIGLFGIDTLNQTLSTTSTIPTYISMQKRSRHRITCFHWEVGVSYCDLPPPWLFWGVSAKAPPMPRAKIGALAWYHTHGITHPVSHPSVKL